MRDFIRDGPGEKSAALARGQREHILGIDEKGGSNPSSYEGKIKNRIYESILDLQLLFHLYDDRYLRAIFGEGNNPMEGPVSHDPIRDNVGFIGTGFEDELGYPREGDKAEGYDGASELEAGFNHLVESNPGVSKASPDTQSALIDSIAFLCRAAEAGQLDINDLVEKGLEKYHREDKDDPRLVSVSDEKEQLVRDRAITKIKTGQDIVEGLSDTEMRALERAGIKASELRE
jgi:hypothetical protein